MADEEACALADVEMTLGFDDFGGECMEAGEAVFGEGSAEAT